MNTSNEFLSQSISYFAVLEQMRDGIFIVDREYSIEYWNPAATAILGYRSQEVCGWSCKTLGPLCKRDASGSELCGEGLCPLATALQVGLSGRYPHYTFLRSSNGREIPLSLSISPLRDPEGAITGAICVFRDMTEEYGQLRLAGEIQKHMVTTRAFVHAGLKVKTLFHPLEVTGGDYVEAFITDTDLLLLSSADATGHGVSAALFAMIYKTLFHSSIKESYSPAEMLAYINNDFCRTSMVEGYYLTASIAIIDPHSRSGFFASAGHPLALLFRKKEDGWICEPVKERSFMIGLVEGAKYQETGFQLQSGDFLFIASDGIYEAEDGAGEPFGIEGVTRFFLSGGRDLEELYALLRKRKPMSDLADDVSAILVEAVD